MPDGAAEMKAANLAPCSIFFASTFRGSKDIPWTAAAQMQSEKDMWTSPLAAIPSVASREDEARSWQPQTSSDGQRHLRWTRSERPFNKLRKKAGREWFTTPSLSVPKLGACSTGSRSEGEAAMLEAKSL